jgi:rubrerythrin/rhodanese-related sulfurtransferase
VAKSADAGGTEVKGPIQDVAAEELRQYMASHKEDDYVLIDVRQPEEYQAGHIPGAKLVPLTELEGRLQEIADLRGKDLFFYCRGGGRSMRAASLVATGLGLPQVHSLVGGITAWKHQVLPDFPRLKALDISGAVPEVLRQALGMEKGAQRFYEALLPHFEGTEVQSFFEELARAEAGHARIVYGALSALPGDPPESFERLFEELPGDLLESGQSFSEATSRAHQIGALGSLALLEMALEMEFNAYDLYRTLADQAESSEIKRALLDLAQQEKRHATALAKKLGKMASQG